MGELKVNRYLKDKAMDRIDHALGRPVDPTGETYRNNFATSADSEEANAFRASPHWIENDPRSWAGKMAFFSVTPAGRAALRDHLRSIADPHRVFNVHYCGYVTPVVAKSRSAARYSYWRDLSDALPDLTFAVFCKHSRVTLASSPAPINEGVE